MANSREMDPLVAELDGSIASFETEKERFRSVLHSYDNQGMRLQDRCVDEAEKYSNDDKHGRVIREQASMTASELRRFSGFRADLATRCAILNFQLRQSALVLMAVALDDPLRLPSIWDPGSLAETARNSLEQAKTRQLLLASEAVVLVRMAIQAQQLATSLVELRQAKLAQHVGEDMSITIARIVKTMEDALNDKTKDLAIENVLLELTKLGANVTKTSVEGMVPGAQFIIGIAARILGLHNPYSKPGAVDAVMDFGDALEREREVGKLDLQLIDALLARIAKPQV